MQAEHDVIIVGGGMVGAAMACALRDTGLSTALVDSGAPPNAAPPSYDDRTVALADSSRRVFEGLGVWPVLAPQAAAIQQIHISDRGRFGFTRLNAADAGLPALGYVVANRAVAAALYDTIRHTQSITLHAPASAENIVVDAAGARVTLASDGGRVLSGRLVIAADGADSPIRTLLGMEARRVDYGQAAVVTAVTPTHPSALRQDPATGGTAYERFTATGPLALLPAMNDSSQEPLADRRYVVVWSMPTTRAEELMKLDDRAFLATLQDQFGDRLGSFTRVGRRQLHPLALTHVAEHVRERVALVGNAAHTVHPVAGQGFNLGLRDVATLAQIVVEAARAGDDIGSLDVLRRYAEWRARDNRAVAGFTHSLIRIFSNDYLPLALARNLGLIAVDLVPPLKRRFIRMTSGLGGTLPRLARGLPL